MLDAIGKIQLTPEVGVAILSEIKRKELALKISEESYKAAQGLQSDLDKYFEQWNNKPVADNELPIIEVSNNLEELIEHTYAKPGLRWRLDCLNKSLGSLRAGDFGFIFARPETGKTTFLASEITAMLEQYPQRPIIWFNNEEQGYKVMFRIYQGYFGITKEQLLSSLKRYSREFIERTDGKFHLFDEAKISRQMVEKVIEKLDPSLVVYDQLPKITGFSADRKDLELGAIFQWGRELAKNSHAAIGVSQADGTAEGVRYLTMEHVANVKTAVQAEADWILGIGRAHDLNLQDIRFLNISKNKLTGDPDSKEDLRHGRFEVGITPSVARYQDLIRFD